MHVLKLFDLTGKTAIVTGAARGLGKQSALALAEAGADVAICDILAEKGKQAEKELRSLGREAVFAAVDVTDVSAVDDFVADVIKRFGGIDVLVNNAAITSSGRPLEDEDDESWRNILEVNVSSVFYVSRAVVRHMKRHGGGVIVNIGSMSGFIINNIDPRHNVPYCVTKGAVLQLTKGMASDWAQHNIRVNAIAPGYMTTDQTNYIRGNEKIKERLIANTPLKRFGSVDDLKGTVVYLASSASTFMTGSIVVIDGGTTIW